MTVSTDDRWDRARRVFIFCLVVVCGLVAAPASSQQPSDRGLGRDFAFPIEVDFDHGATNGDAIIMRLLPLASFPMGERWKLINLTLAVIADAPGGVPGQPGNPDPVDGPPVFGLGDLTDAVFFTPPTGRGDLVWGFGPALAIPIATDPGLGSGKWSAGPALRVAYRPGRWNLGAVGIYLRSFAGDTDRGDVNQLLIRGLLRYRLKNGWYLTSNPIITSNFNATSDQQWLVPVGGGIGRRFPVGRSEMAVSAHYYSNVIKPDGAPDGLFRIDVVVPIPRGLRK